MCYQVTSDNVLFIHVYSESSLFVSKRRLILKTCGTTTPLQCLAPLLAMAEQIGGFTDVEALFYSRKNFKRPDLQVSNFTFVLVSSNLQFCDFPIL